MASQQGFVTYDQLKYDMQHAPSVKLLKMDNAPFILDFLYHQFKQPPRHAMERALFLSHLETYLMARQREEPGVYPRSPQEYLAEWADEQHRFVKIRYPSNSDEPVVELMSATHQAMGWMEDLSTAHFVGTESRFLHVVDWLTQLVQETTESASGRIRRLEQQRTWIDHQIATIQQDGLVVSQFTSTQLRERFLEICHNVRQLQRDFSFVEEHFRTIAHEIWQARMDEDMNKGMLVAHVLDADDALKLSEQGKSFYSFCTFLMAAQQQQGLYSLLDSVLHLPVLQELMDEGYVLQSLPGYLIEASQKVIQSTNQLAEQLKQSLDRKTMREYRRLAELLSQITYCAQKALETTCVDDAHFLLLEGAPVVRFPVGRQLSLPKSPLSFKKASRCEPKQMNEDDFHRHFPDFFIDMNELRRRIAHVLTQEQRHEVSLQHVVHYYPLTKGLAEVLAYCLIATQETNHEIDRLLREQIPFRFAFLKTEDDVVLTLPVLRYRRSDYAEYTA